MIAEALESRELLVASLVTALPDVALGADSTAVDLLDYMDDDEVDGRVVKITTDVGDLLIETFDDVTPLTANNFVQLVQQGRFDEMFFHRSMPNFVLQGGGFVWTEADDQIQQVEHFGALTNEFSNWFDPQYGDLAQGTPVNTRGTLSMAKLSGDANSATSQFFINLADNSTNLDSQNGGFTVFAQIIKGTMTVADQMTGLQRVNVGAPFETLPVQNFQSGDVSRDHVISSTSVIVDELSFSVTGNSNPGLIQTSLQDGRLVITPVAQSTGTAQITVQATDLAGEVVTDTFAVTVGPPEQTVITGPTGSDSQRPTITWTEAAGATTYQLWVNEIGGQNSVISESQLTVNQFQPGADLANGSYRAWVRSSNLHGWSQWSEAFDFSVGSAPGTPTLTGPSGSTSASRPTLSWSAVSGVDYYDLWVNAVGVQNQIIRETALTGTSFTPDTDLPDGMYRAWLRAENSAGTSSWSQSISFEITAGVISAITGPSGTSIAARPEITWTGDSSATYELWVNAIGGQARIVHDTSISGTSFTPTTDLADGDYRAWVRQRPAGEAAGQWSFAYEFTVGQKIEPGQAAISNVTGLDTARPTFVINETNHAVRYELWVNLEGGSSRILHQTDITNLQYQATSDLATGNYRAWLRAFSSDDTAGAWSAVYEFTLS